MSTRARRRPAVPWASAMTCISTCRGPSMYFSMYTASSPKAFGPRGRPTPTRGQRRGVAHHAHALAAATGRGLEQHREPERLGQRHRLGRIAHRLGGAGHHRHAVRDGQLPRRRLGAHGLDGLGRRAHPDQARLAHSAGEPGPLRQEPVAGVDGIGAQALGHLDEAVAQQVGLRRGRRADAHGLVGREHEGRAGVRVGVHGHRGDAQVAAGADDAQRDLAAVGDEQLADGPHSGMLPCFLGGFLSRLPCSAVSAPMSRGRVSRGSMTSSR
jgi:hypothetical protein